VSGHINDPTSRRDSALFLDFRANNSIDGPGKKRDLGLELHHAGAGEGRTVPPYSFTSGS